MMGRHERESAALTLHDREARLCRHHYRGLLLRGLRYKDQQALMELKRKVKNEY